MMLKEIASFLDAKLMVNKITDDSLNGLQVEASEDVRKIAFAVDANLDTIKKAKGFDLLVVHHGLLWGKLEPVTGILQKRIKLLLDNKCSLYAAHLPLDMHSSLGNNIVIAKLLGLRNIQRFALYHGNYIGFKGEIKEMPLQQFKKFVEEKLNAKCILYNFGKQKIRRIGISSGRSSFALKEAAYREIDVLLTGEIVYETINDAKDSCMSIITAGHYETEVFGVKALMQLLKKKGFSCEFIE